MRNNEQLGCLKLLLEEEESKRKEIVGHKDKENKSVKAEVKRLENSHINLTERANRAETQATELQSALELEVAEKEQAKKQESALQDKINGFEKGFEKMKKQESDAAGNLELMGIVTQEKEALTKEVKHLKSLLEKLETEIETQKTKYKELFLSAESAKAELSRVHELAREKMAKKEENCTRRGLDADQINTNGSAFGGPPVHVVHEVQSICFSEAIQPGSCQRGRNGTKKCKFSHDITQQMRGDNKFMELLVNAKDEKASKCINEFRKEKSCNKGKTCRFSHAITEHHRNDPALRESMAERYQQLTGRPFLDPSYQSPTHLAMSADHSWHGTNEFYEGERCNVNSQIPGPTHDSNQNFAVCPSTADNTTYNQYQPMPMQQQQQYPPQASCPVSNASPRPLMAVPIKPSESIHAMPINSGVQSSPENLQAINLLRNLVSHLMTTSQFHGQEHYPSIINYP